MPTIADAGQQAEQLLSRSIQFGTATLGSLAAKAIRRHLSEGAPYTPWLFTDGELTILERSLAAVGTSGKKHEAFAEARSIERTLLACVKAAVVSTENLSGLETIRAVLDGIGLTPTNPAYLEKVYYVFAEYV